MDERNYKNESLAVAASKQPKSLFQITEGAKITGVANGIATYLNVEPKIVRGVFIFLTIITKGAWIAAYLVLVFIIPVAKTKEDLARARGEILIDPAVSRQYAHPR